MARYDNLFNYFRQCPHLSNMMSIAGTSDRYNTIILPQGSSPTVEYQDGVDVNGNYFCHVVPYASIYEDFQINCYEWYDENDTNPPETNENVLSYEQVCGVCDWIKTQNENRNFPDINEQIVSIECNPFVPQIRYVDNKKNTVGYFITVRIRYVNNMRKDEFI